MKNMLIECFDDVIRYLEGTYSTEKAPSLKDERTYRPQREEQLLEMLSNPQKSYSIIHVAGSKGKGSTSAYLAALATTGINKVGIYASPHVISYKERWTFIKDVEVGIEEFDEQDYVNVANKMQSILKDHRKITSLPGGVPPTAFEMYTAYAFLLFKEMNITLAVIETGLGGRLDATNVVNPTGVVLTHIELEHTNILGNTLEEITREKCGIIKKNTFVVSAPQEDVVRDTILEEVEKKASIVKFADEDEIGFIPFIREFVPSQRENIGLAIKAAQEFGFRDCDTFEQIYEKVKNVRLRGRSEIILESNAIIMFDGAHTKDSIRRLCKDVRNLPRCTRVNYVKESSPLTEPSYPSRIPERKAVIFAASEDKDIKGMLEELIYEFDEINITKFNSEYKKCNSKKTLLMLEEVMNEHKDHNLQAIYYHESPDICLERYLGDSDKPVFVVVTGSFYLISELLYK